MLAYNGPWGLVKWTETLRGAQKASLEELMHASGREPYVLQVWEEFNAKAGNL